MTASSVPGSIPARPQARPAVRSRRDWYVDTTLFLGAAVLGVLTAGDLAQDPARPAWFLALDQFAGAVACCLLWFRRRWPTALALACAVGGIFFHFVGWPQLVFLFSVAVHRRTRSLALVTAVTVATLPLQRPEPGTSGQENTMIGLMLVLAAVGWGMFVHSRRQLVASLEERALRAEAETDLRVRHAQREAREEIAREMHDVLAHRLSLLSVHAGALEFRRDAPPGEVAGAAGVIRRSAHQALEDLREVIGVLRAPGAEAEERPQPSVADLRLLVAEADGAGAGVRFEEELASEQVPGALARTAYRVVQEGLTNARKHAPGTPVDVRISGAPGGGLRVRVANELPQPHAAHPELPGAGAGLIGLGERVELAGGTLAHGPGKGRDRTRFVLDAWLPWSV